MTAGGETQWRPCTDRRLVHGLMRELLLWETPLALEAPAGPLSGIIAAIEEPEDATDPSARWLRIRTDRPPPDFALTVSTIADLGALRWTADVAAGGRCLRIRMPDAIEVDAARATAAVPAGRQVAAVFCRSGATTGPFLNRNAGHVRTFCDRFEQDWDDQLFRRFVETDEDKDGAVTGFLTYSRIGDRLWLPSDLARYRPGGPAGGMAFTSQTFLAMRERATSVCAEPAFALNWAPGHPFWASFENHLQSRDAALTMARFRTAYIRFEDPDDAPRGDIALRPLSAFEAAKALPRIADADAARLAELMGVGRPLSESILAGLLRSAGAEGRREVAQIERGGEPVGLALFPGLPLGWNLRMTCNCVWVFPYATWRPDDPAPVLASIRGDSRSREAPGVLLVVSPLAKAAPGRPLDWRIVTGAALDYFGQPAPGQGVTGAIP